MIDTVSSVDCGMIESYWLKEIRDDFRIEQKILFDPSVIFK